MVFKMWPISKTVIKTKDTKKAHFLQYVYAKINEKSKSVLKYIMLPLN